MENGLKLSKDIKMVISDFDGVFTDGTFLLDENLNVQKKVNFVDVMGVFLLLKAGVNFGIISGEMSNILNYFKKTFDVEEIHGGVREKGYKILEVMERQGLKRNEVLYIGDDVNDIPAFGEADYKIAPNNANPLVKMLPDIQVTKLSGGNGAFREMADCLISYKK